MENMENTVTGTLWYLNRLPIYQTTKPYIANLPLSVLPLGTRTNQVPKAYDGIRIRDIRAYPESFSLDHHGFMLSEDLKTSLEYDDFRDPTKVSDTYCQEMMRGLEQMTGAEVSSMIHQAIRRRHHSFPAFPRGSNETNDSQPIQSVHCDFTPYEAFKCLQTLFTKDTAIEYWKKRRVQILHIWRPLSGPVKDWPLAVCDTTTVDATSDLLPTDNVYADYVSETYNVFHNSNHSWYYCSGQASHEALIFKGFDNAQGVASFCAHAAFELEQVTDVGKFRESVECTIVLVYPEETSK